VFFLQLHTVLSSSTVMDPTENAEAVTVLSELAVEPVVVPCSTQSAWIRYFRWIVHAFGRATWQHLRVVACGGGGRQCVPANLQVTERAGYHPRPSNAALHRVP
jgi:hypothetical protein